MPSKRRERDNYPTPDWAIDVILPHLPTSGAVTEPSCGDGAILRRLLARHPSPRSITAVEIDRGRARRASSSFVEAGFNQGVVVRDDFLRWASRAAVPRIDLIVGNPPFSLATEFVEACLALAKPQGATVALLLRLAFLESADRAAFHRREPADLYPLAKRPSFTSNGRTDSAAYAWWVWGPRRGGRWFPPLLPGGSS